MFRLKFKVEQVASTTKNGKKSFQVNLRPIVCPENKQAWNEVPMQGIFSLNDLSEDAGKVFSPDVVYYMDIYPVDTPKSMIPSEQKSIGISDEFFPKSEIRDNVVIPATPAAPQVKDDGF